MEKSNILWEFTSNVIVYFFIQLLFEKNKKLKKPRMKNNLLDKKCPLLINHMRPRIRCNVASCTHGYLDQF